MSAVRRQLYPNGAAATSAIFTLFPVRRSESLLFILPTKGEVPGVIVSGCCLSLIMTAPFVRDSAGCRKNAMRVRETSGWVGQTHEGAPMYLHAFYATQNVWMSV